jgi:hypothetical protein
MHPIIVRAIGELKNAEISKIFSGSSGNAAEPLASNKQPFKVKRDEKLPEVSADQFTLALKM